MLTAGPASPDICACGSASFPAVRCPEERPYSPDIRALSCGSFPVVGGQEERPNSPDIWVLRMDEEGGTKDPSPGLKGGHPLPIRLNAWGEGEDELPRHQPDVERRGVQQAG